MSTPSNQPNPESHPQNIVPMPEPKPRRVRGDAFWSRLTPEHRKQIHTWLFEEHITYRDAHQRATQQLGLDCSLATIGRCYHYILREQAADEAADAQDSARTILQSGVNLKEVNAASMQLIATRLLEKAMDHADTKELSALGRLVLASEEKEIRRERARFMREKFEFNASKAVLKLLPMAEQIKEEDMKLEEKRWRDIQWKLFGSQLYHMILPDGQVNPFTPETYPVKSDCLTSAQINPAGNDKTKEKKKSRHSQPNLRPVQ